MYNNNFVAVIKCGGKILREQNGAVYLPFGAEYSVLIKNKDARKALVEIEVDGDNALSGHSLIVNGNDTQEIKGFMRDMRKTNRFKFIQKTKEIQKHRGDRIDDGLVRVVYQFEQRPAKPINIQWRSTKKNRTYDLGSSTTDFVNYGIGTETFCCNSVISSAPLSDEGITVKGNKIDQAYQYGDIGPLESNKHTIVLHLKGATGVKKKLVKKPLTTRTKVGCVTCGRKNRSTNKFCYNCGTYLK